MQGVRRSLHLRTQECGGGSICEHGRRKSRCKECGGGSICEHGRIKSRCKQCGSGSKAGAGGIARTAGIGARTQGQAGPAAPGAAETDGAGLRCAEDAA
jgi:hypothetical protein